MATLQSAHAQKLDQLEAAARLRLLRDRFPARSNVRDLIRPNEDPLHQGRLRSNDLIQAASHPLLQQDRGVQWVGKDYRWLALPQRPSPAFLQLHRLQYTYPTTKVSKTCTVTHYFYLVSLTSVWIHTKPLFNKRFSQTKMVNEKLMRQVQMILTRSTMTGMDRSTSSLRNALDRRVGTSPRDHLPLWQS